MYFFCGTPFFERSDAMSLKIAISGKGGVGKTTLASVLSYLYAREGYSVLAIDGDPDMNLYTALGLENPPPPVSELQELIEERVRMDGGMYRLNPFVDDIFSDYSAENMHGIKLIVLGTIERGGDGCFCPESAFLRAVLRKALFREKDVVILDLEAGIEHLGRGTSKGVDIMVVVIEPGTRSLETLERIVSLSKDIGISRVGVVVNKYLPGKFDSLLNSIEHPVLGKIPFDRCFIEADMEGKPPYETCPLEPFEEIKKNVEKLI